MRFLCLIMAKDGKTFLLWVVAIKRNRKLKTLISKMKWKCFCRVTDIRNKIWYCTAGKSNPCHLVCWIWVSHGSLLSIFSLIDINLSKANFTHYFSIVIILIQLIPFFLRRKNLLLTVSDISSHFTSVFHLLNRFPIPGLHCKEWVACTKRRQTECQTW